jgi:hypothetical protein
LGKREPTVGRQPLDSQLHAIGRVNTLVGDFIELKLDISEEKGLFFLLDTGADVSVVKSKKLIGTTEFESQQKVRLKCIDGSVVETHGLVKTQVREGKVSIPMEFQFVNKQVISKETEKDFLTKMKAQICYKSKSVKFKCKNFSFENKLTNTG